MWLPVRAKNLQFSSLGCPGEFEHGGRILPPRQTLILHIVLPKASQKHKNFRIVSQFLKGPDCNPVASVLVKAL